MRCSQGRIQDLPLGGGGGWRQPSLEGGANPQHRHFLVKTYVKMKEFGPVGGGGDTHWKLLYVDPPLVHVNKIT